MKSLLLLALFSLPALSALANDGLIQVPDSAIITTQPATGLIFADDQTAEMYTNQVLEKIKAMKKSVLATRATALRPSREVGCLPFHDAFGFEQVNDTDYKVNCFAGSDRNISHVLDYNLRLVFMPATCASEQSVRDFFKIPNNRTKAQAERFWAQLQSYCAVMAAPIDAANPIARNVAIDPNFVKQVLDQKEDLRLYVSGSRAKKQSTSSSSGQKYTNPLRSSTSAD